MKRIRRILLITCGTLLVLAAVAAGSGYLWMRGSLPQTEGEIRIAALQAPVKILRNSDGLVNMQQRMENLRGSCRLSSRPGKYLEISL